MHQNELAFDHLKKTHHNLDALKPSKVPGRLKRLFLVMISTGVDTDSSDEARFSNMASHRVFKTKVAVILTALLAGFFSLTYMPQPTDGAVTAQRGGAAIYAQYCARCHGNDGRGQTRKGREIDAVDFTSDDWSPDTGHDTRIVTRGKGSMPGFGAKLNPTQISSVVQYIRRFKR